MTANGVQSVNGWDDFEWFIDSYLPKQTISVLRSFGDTIQTSTGTWLGIKSQEKKANLVAKIEHGFRTMRNQNDINTYRRVRRDCEAMGVPMKTYHYTPAPTFGGMPANGAGSSSFHSPSAAPLPHQNRYNPATSGFQLPVGNGYGSGSRANGSGWGHAHVPQNAYAQRGPGPSHTLQDWKASPMWKPIKALTSMEMLPDIGADEHSHTRREKKATFLLSPDIIEKMTHSKANPHSLPHYSIRLFCTSSEHYKPPNTPYQPATAHITNRHIPIEYPSNPDACVDEHGIPFKERGLRGKAGSAPPLDLNKGTRGITLSMGRLTTVNMGHTGPTVGKKKELAKRFWYQVVFAEMTTKEELLNCLLRLNPTSAEESLAQTRRRDDDDDIEVGTSKLSLKDPLSYMRITRPVRSSKCTHIQCFDANWWIESNGQHPQWLCPLCNKELRFDDLIVDGFFMGILNTVPDSVDEVVIESTGEWHTDDNKFGAPTWLSTHAPPLTTNGHATPRPPTHEPTPKLSPDSPDRKGKRKAIEVLSSDDDEDEVPLARVNGGLISSRPNGQISSSSTHQPSLPPAPTRTPSTAPTRQPSPPAGGRGVIDLTADSSDEEDEEDGLERMHFPRPDAGYTSRAADDSIRNETDVRQNSFGLTGRLDEWNRATQAGDAEARLRLDGGEWAGTWDIWQAQAQPEGDWRDDMRRFGKRMRPSASDWMEEEGM